MAVFADALTHFFPRPAPAPAALARARHATFDMPLDDPSIASDPVLAMPVLDQLESRQDQILRQLDELNARIERLLAEYDRQGLPQGGPPAKAA